MNSATKIDSNVPPLFKVSIKHNFRFEVQNIASDLALNAQILSQLQNLTPSKIISFAKFLKPLLPQIEEQEDQRLTRFVVKLLEHRPQTTQQVALLGNSYDLRIHNDALTRILQELKKLPVDAR